MKSIFEANGVRRLIGRGAAMAVLCAAPTYLNAVSCAVTKHNAPSDAEKAMLIGDYQKAERLYRAARDVDATVGLVHALLRQQKVDDAEEAVKDALDAAPKSAALITARGEVELREGEPWLVEPTVIESYKLDPCNARTRLLYARVLELSSRYATAKQQILLAHEFDPADPEIHLMWLETLPLDQREQELEAYLAAPSGDDQARLAEFHGELDRLKKEAAEPPRTCRLTSASAAAEIPFIRLAGYAGHTRAYGLEVGFDGATARLQLDTRSAGLTLYRAAAEHAGLKRIGVEEKSGAGKANYTAVADTVHIGSLEFKDCAVNVIDSASPFDDGVGMIGIDVFSDFLVTVDFPMRKVSLAALPARPGEPAFTPSLKSIAADWDPLEGQVEAAKPAAAGAEVAAANTPAAKSMGPFDRYIAPEMKDWTQIYRAGHDLILPTALASDKVKLFVADASVPATNIAASAALDVAKVHEDKSMEQAGPGGVTAKVFVADEITFNFAHVAQKLNGVVSADTSWASKADAMQISGFLGMNTLSLLTLHIDYRDGLLKAEYVPGRGYKFE
jgi:tetratricopeptide (TPR) repeat protein